MRRLCNSTARVPDARRIYLQICNKVRYYLKLNVQSGANGNGDLNCANRSFWKNSYVFMDCSDDGILDKTKIARVGY